MELGDFKINITFDNDLNLFRATLSSGESVTHNDPVIAFKKARTLWLTSLRKTMTKVKHHREKWADGLPERAHYINMRKRVFGARIYK